MATIKRKKKKSLYDHVKGILLTGTSHMLPVVVVGGFLQAIAKLIGGINVATAVGTFPYTIYTLGVTTSALVVPTLCATIAWGIADKVAIAPGLAIGYLSSSVIGAGFVGGVFGGVMVGYVCKYLKTVKVPDWFGGLMRILFIPLFTTVLVGLILYYIVGGPIAAAMDMLKQFILSMRDTSRIIFGGLLGICWLDYGGPITQTAAGIVNGLNADGIYGPSAAKMAIGMAPPIAMAICCFLNKKKYTKGDIENAKVAIPLGCCFITEGAIPFFLSDPIRVWCATIPGCMVGGALCMYFGVESIATHGGIFAVPLMSDPLKFLIALAANIVVEVVIYSFLRRPLASDAEETPTL